jgi:hypothetical protein
MKNIHLICHIPDNLCETIDQLSFYLFRSFYCSAKNNFLFCFPNIYISLLLLLYMKWEFYFLFKIILFKYFRSGPFLETWKPTNWKPIGTITDMSVIFWKFSVRTSAVTVIILRFSLIFFSLYKQMARSSSITSHFDHPFQSITYQSHIVDLM